MQMGYCYCQGSIINLGDKPVEFGNLVSCASSGVQNFKVGVVTLAQ